MEYLCICTEFIDYNEMFSSINLIIVQQSTHQHAERLATKMVWTIFQVYFFHRPLNFDRNQFSPFIFVFTDKKMLDWHWEGNSIEVLSLQTKKLETEIRNAFLKRLNFTHFDTMPQTTVLVASSWYASKRPIHAELPYHKAFIWKFAGYAVCVSYISNQLLTCKPKLIFFIICLAVLESP